jgi:hypothetical protein
MRALATNGGDLPLLDLLETQHIATHPVSPWCVVHGPLGASPDLPASPSTVWSLDDRARGPRDSRLDCKSP